MVSIIHGKPLLCHIKRAQQMCETVFQKVKYIAALNEVNKFAEDTFQLQTEQDAELASAMTQ